jgi:large subunit ribosomal protein L24
MKIKKGDNVIVITGKDKGKTGSVEKVFPKKDLVLVSGVNVVKRHQRSRTGNGKGQIVDKAMPVHISNVAATEKKAKTVKAPKKVKKS